MAIGTPTSIGTNVITGVQSSLTLTTTGAINSGDLALIAIETNSAGAAVTVSSVSDGTNSYTKATSLTGSGGGVGMSLEIWYKANASPVGSGATVTVTLSGSTAGAGERHFVFGSTVSGTQAATPLDKTNTQSGTSSSPSVATGTLTNSNEIVIGVMGYSTASSYVESSGFTNIATANNQNAWGMAWAYQIVAATTTVTYAPNAGTTPTLEMLLVASFIGAAGATVVPGGARMLLGVG